jgi:ribosomal protein L37E
MDKTRPLKILVAKLVCCDCGFTGLLSDFIVLDSEDFGPDLPLLCRRCDCDEFLVQVNFKCEECGTVGTPVITQIEDSPPHFQCKKCGASTSFLITWRSHVS